MQSATVNSRPLGVQHHHHHHHRGNLIRRHLSMLTDANNAKKLTFKIDNKNIQLTQQRD